MQKTRMLVAQSSSLKTSSVAVVVITMAGIVSSCGQGRLKTSPAKSENAAASSAEAGANPKASGAPEGSGNEITQLASDVQEILRRSCDSCHGAGGTSSGGLKNITVLSHLVNARYVVPGDSAGSKLYKRIDDGTMPPPGGQSLSPDEKKKIQKWIDDGAHITAAQSHGRERVDLIGGIMDTIQKDFSSLDPTERTQARYFTTWPSWNLDVSQDEITDLQQGLAKFLNSVSMSDKLIAPKKLDEQGTVYRIFLSNYGWSPQRWQLATELETLFRNHPSAATLRAQLGAEVPVVRIDEFIANNATAPMYYNLQGLQPNLNEFLRVDVKRGDLSTLYTEVAARQAVVNRLGFNDSQVADFSRVIERHSKAGSPSFWMSHEFGSQNADQDPFQRPLGPQQLSSAINGEGTAGISPNLADPTGLSNLGLSPEAFQSLSSRDQLKILEALREQNGVENGDSESVESPVTPSGSAFRPDGHEIIFEKPNGMIGFYVALANGTRIDQAPSGVRDTTNSSAEIPVGASCMACHYEGVIPKEDEISKTFKASTLPGPAQEIFNLIYGTNPSSLFESDRSLYQSSLSKIGVDHKREDPIHRIFKSFNKSATRKEVAEILGVSDIDFEAALKQLPTTVQNAWNALLVADGQIARKNVTNNLRAALTRENAEAPTDEQISTEQEESIKRRLQELGID